MIQGPLKFVLFICSGMYYKGYGTHHHHVAAGMILNRVLVPLWKLFQWLRYLCQGCQGICSLAFFFPFGRPKFLSEVYILSVPY